MSAISDDTKKVKEEFEAISTPTQVFIACLVGLGLLGGGTLGYALAVDTLDDNDPAECIEWQDETYCLSAPNGDDD